MPSKKRIQFNNIIKEFGFPTDVEKIRCTYKDECFDENSQMSKLAEEFEERLDQEICWQNSNPDYKIEEEIGDQDLYERFQDIFLEYQEIFDPEIYLLQMSVLLEEDLNVFQKIRNIVNAKGLGMLPDQFIEQLFHKDTDAVSNFIQLLTEKGVSERTAINTAQVLQGLPEESVWLPTSNKRSIQSLITTIKNRLVDSDVVLCRGSEQTATLNILNSQVYIGNKNYLHKRENENKKRYELASKELDLKEKIKKITPSDLKYVFKYDNLGRVIENGLQLTDELAEEIKDEAHVLRDPITNRPYSQEEIENVINSSLKYIDFDKLLLTILQIEFDKHGENIEDFSYDEIVELKSLSEKIKNLLGKGKASIKIPSDRFAGKRSFEEIYANIEELRSSYISGEFYTQDEINSVYELYITGERDVRELTPYEFKNVLKFTDGEILIMLNKDPTLLDYLIENNILDNDEKKSSKSSERILALVEKQDKITAEQLQTLYQKGLLTQEYLLKLYMTKNKVDIEDIQILKESIDEHFFDGMVSSSELIELYLDKDKKKEEFDKYRKLYKKIVIDGKTLEEKNNISVDILEQSMELLKDEYLLELNTLGLITIDTVIDYTGEQSIDKLFLSNQLKPTDARRLFYEGKISEEMLKKIMLDPTIDEGKKITLLYSTFPDVEDTEIMKRLEMCLREVKENSITNAGTSKRHKKNEDPIKDENDNDGVLKKLKRAYEPRAKYRLLEAIDDEYKFNYNVKDGTAIFFFPNRDEYLIEKLYAKGRMPATDTATYVLSKSLYEQNKDRIIQDGKINISELYALKKSNIKGIKRFVHTGWANGIVKYYDLDNPDIYSKKKIAEYKRLAEIVEKSKQEIER